MAQVWQHNFIQELSRFDGVMGRGNVIVSIDTEFPGCLHPTPRCATETERYADMKSNVDDTRLIQLGLTLSDGNAFQTWEFNFAFDLDKDRYAEDSVGFLKKNGINFEKLRKEGIKWDDFGQSFAHLLSRHRNRLTWVTFHGLYDLAYLLKLVTGKRLPILRDFAKSLADNVGGTFVDLKFCAMHFKDLMYGQLGLEKLGKLLGVYRVDGAAHHAGSDSLLTASVFWRMSNTCSPDRSGWMRILCSPDHYGSLYGLSISLSLVNSNSSSPPDSIAATPPALCYGHGAYFSVPTVNTTVLVSY
ncbi:hypothetical protein Tsubulata_026271 [Turnera subulata]|uniref:poly(A)-specific ribonuclease n=1 Tax=Turnera subulata TaxID=218843 RepID=A0A9Q0FDR5_9ROSI|nr:hypothetical protein Tsubulata_026271 [Turnera subulata]